MADAEWFAGRLRELREAAGLSQAALAERAGLTREGIAQLETGRRKPAWESVLTLATALDVKCDDFAQKPAAAAPRGPGRPAKTTVKKKARKPARRPRKK